ncbi:MAG: hypothetical protein ACYT04_24215 [Nostoc sp.]
MQANASNHFNVSETQNLSKTDRTELTNQELVAQHYFYWNQTERLSGLSINPPKPQSPCWVAVWRRFYSLIFALEKLDKLRRSLTRDFPKIGNYFWESWGGESMRGSPNLEFNIGDRLRWTDAPDCWNPTGEKIRGIGDDTALLDYSAVAIPISHLILINSAPKLESSPSEKSKVFPSLGKISVNKGVAV